MADDPESFLTRLVKLALNICDADSAGIDVLQGDVFRCLTVAGELAAFEGTTVPRNFSPEGICIDRGRAIVMERPERLFGYLADANITIPELLIVPLLGEGGTPIGTLWIVAREGQHLNSEHERLMTELATFAAIAVQKVQSLKKALEEKETVSKEMSHRIKNFFAITDSMLRLTSHNVQTKEELAESLTGRLHALSEAHGLVRESFGSIAKAQAIELRELAEAMLRPYSSPNIEGATIRLGEDAASSIALILHELATNAAKYGALSVDRGSVRVVWEVAQGNLHLQWREDNGPEIRPPTKKGFGSALLERSIAGLGGTLNHSWFPHGLTVHIDVPMDRLAR
jgi:two-component sensor histidine kinase